MGYFNACRVRPATSGSFVCPTVTRNFGGGVVGASHRGRREVSGRKRGLGGCSWGLAGSSVTDVVCGWEVIFSKKGVL